MPQETEVQALADQLAIIERITELFVATDARDWPKVIDCFADSVHFDMSSFSGQPAADISARDIADGWEQGLRPIKSVHHQMGNALASPGGDRATASCYAVAYHYLPNPSGSDLRMIAGSYDFELQRSEAGWKIHLFRLNLHFVDGNKDLGRA